MNWRTLLVESLPQGTLFFVPGHPCIYSELPMGHEAAARFLSELSRELHGTFTVKTADDLVQRMIDAGRLFVANKEDKLNKPVKTVKCGPLYKFRPDGHGLLSMANLKVWAENGHIDRDTDIEVLNQHGRSLGIYKANDILDLDPVFGDEHSVPLTPSCTVVSGCDTVPSDFVNDIATYFGLDTGDSVALVHKYGDNSTERVKNLGGLRE